MDGRLGGYVVGSPSTLEPQTHSLPDESAAKTAKAYCRSPLLGDVGHKRKKRESYDGGQLTTSAATSWRTIRVVAAPTSPDSCRAARKSRAFPPPPDGPGRRLAAAGGLVCLRHRVMRAPRARFRGACWRFPCATRPEPVNIRPSLDLASRNPRLSPDDCERDLQMTWPTNSHPSIHRLSGPRAWISPYRLWKDTT